MSVLSTKNKLDLAAVFMSLALAQPAGAVLPMQANGHVDTMPVYGATEDKVCTFLLGKYPVTQRAGDWATFNPGATAQNVVMVMGNDCKRRMMTINPVDLQLTEMRSHQEVLGFHPPKVPNAVPAPAKWWEKPNLLPAKPQGEVQVSGPPAGGPRVCTVKIGTTQVIQAPPIVLIIPDATRAFYLTTRRDPSIKGERISANESVDYGEEGKPVCTLEPLITLPTGTSTMTMAGGGLRTPGRITPPAKPVVPVAAVPEMVAMTGMVAAFALLSATYLEKYQAQMANGAIIYPSAADLPVAIKEAMGLSAEQLGELASRKYDDAEAQAHIKRLDDTPINIFSKNPPPGDCSPNEHENLQREVKKFCGENEGAAPRSCKGDMGPMELYYLLDKNRQCAIARETIMNRCFSGGDLDHREQARNAWTRVKNCADYLRRLPGLKP